MSRSHVARRIRATLIDRDHMIETYTHRIRPAQIRVYRLAVLFAPCSRSRGGNGTLSEEAFTILLAPRPRFGYSLLAMAQLGTLQHFAMGIGAFPSVVPRSACLRAVETTPAFWLFNHLSAPKAVGWM